MGEMENTDVVDVSWLHHWQKDHLERTKSAPSVTIDKEDLTISALPSIGTGISSTESPEGANGGHLPASSKAILSPMVATHQTPKQKKGSPEIGDPGDSVAQSPPLSNINATKGVSAKPAMGPRRNSWISSLSSKFSSYSTSPPQSYIKDAANSVKASSSSPKLEQINPFGAAYGPKDKDEKKDASPHTSNSNSPRSHPSFFHNAFRKLSSSGGSGLGKLASHGGVCQRRVMNVDQNRDRCKIPELNQAKLRRVSFCVDVEIAGTSHPSEPEEDGGTGSRDAKRSKAPESQHNKTNKKSEAKGPEVIVIGRSNDSDSNAKPERSGESAIKIEEAKVNGQGKEPTRKQEKKKRSEEERKERKERKRRQAEANGSIPLELNRDGEANGSTCTPLHGSSKVQDQPTTDPLRIYRRCCQLRETVVLKKLVEQISLPSSTLAESPGTVAVLDLTGYRMSLTDVVTFSDWLAVVPVRKLILENCSLTDEAVRIILAGLLSTKTIEESKYGRGLVKKASGETVHGVKRFGAIEKLCLKNNPKIGPEGWRHIGLFIHMSKSLKGIDLSGIPFPQPPMASGGLGPLARPGKSVADISTVFANALAQRFAGSHLEELILSECYPTPEDIDKICDAAHAVGLRRLGLANNRLGKEGLEHVARYLRAGCCEGLDLGGNEVNEHLDLLASVIYGNHPLSALSLADCGLAPKSLSSLLQALTCLPNFRFIDLSHNRGLFATQPDSLAMLRRYLPQMPELKRIHLADVGLSSDHAIALAEILPDCRKLCHFNILENPKIQALAAATDATTQEEACALYTSLMTAVRVSRTLIAVDVDVPSANNNEVVKALASQIMAYSLCNLERGALVEEFSNSADDIASEKQVVPVPDILVHIVGHVDGEGENSEEVAAAPDEDYVIGGTGVVKALGVCLGNADYNTLEPSLDSTSSSDTPIPLPRVSHVAVAKKPRDMSKHLLNSARKIRIRLQPALIREDREGNDVNYRRLQFLDLTLQRMIERFEDEFPDTRLPSSHAPTKSVAPMASSQHSSQEESPDQSNLDDSVLVDNSALGNGADVETVEDEDANQYVVKLTRTNSNTSLQSRALTSEEGRVHRFSQHLRRDILDSGLDSHGGAVAQDPDETWLVALREKLDRLSGDEIRSRIETVGPDKALNDLGASVEELLMLKKQDPEAFESFKESQIAAQINAGMRSNEG